MHALLHRIHSRLSAEYRWKTAILAQQEVAGGGGLQNDAADQTDTAAAAAAIQRKRPGLDEKGKSAAGVAEMPWVQRADSSNADVCYVRDAKGSATAASGMMKPGRDADDTLLKSAL
jgi:hypothetical protein